MATDEIVHSRDGGVTFSGPDAISVVRALTIWSGLGLMIATQGRVIPTRGMTRRKMLDLVTGITKKEYKNTWAEAERARVDVKIWADEMRAAIPEYRAE